MKAAIFIMLIFVPIAFGFTISNTTALPSTLIAGNSYDIQIQMQSVGPFVISFETDLNGNTNPNLYSMTSPEMNCQDWDDSTGINESLTDWVCGNYTGPQAGTFVVDLYFTPSFFISPGSITVDTVYTAAVNEPVGTPLQYAPDNGFDENSGGEYYGSSYAYYTSPYDTPYTEMLAMNELNNSNQTPVNIPVQTIPSKPAPVQVVVKPSIKANPSVVQPPSQIQQVTGKIMQAPVQVSKANQTSPLLVATPAKPKSGNTFITVIGIIIFIGILVLLWKVIFNKPKKKKPVMVRVPRYLPEDLGITEV